ncbi:TVP38/TMEM64 family protein [Nocardioidaceae bacterium]|nr:TVP38/TMEM64 family protein [Nocardioidaceae bacterium]
MTGGGGGRRRWTRSDVGKVVGLLALVAVVAVAGLSGVLPSVGEVREQVRGYGALAPVAYVVAYGVLTLFPTPASLLTIAGGALFGLVEGTAYALLGALLGAVAAYEIGRLLGRDAVDRLTRGRLEPVERVLSQHGFLAVVAIRLTPVFPFLLVNYASGLTSLTRRDYVLGTAVGIVPGAVAYAAVGAYGADPLGLFAAIAGLVLLTLVGGYVGRRMLRREGIDPDRATDPDADASAHAPGDDR